MGTGKGEERLSRLHSSGSKGREMRNSLVQLLGASGAETVQLGVAGEEAERVPE